MFESKKKLKQEVRSLKYELKQKESLLKSTSQLLAQAKRGKERLHKKWISLLDERGLSNAKEMYVCHTFKSKLQAKRFTETIDPFVSKVDIYSNGLNHRVEVHVPDFYVDMISEVAGKVIAQDEQMNHILKINHNNNEDHTT